MTFDQFVEEASSKVGYNPTKIQGVSNIARSMEGCVFLGGPNLQNLDGTKPYGFCSKISFSPTTHLFFCLNFGNKTAELARAVSRLDSKRINNCKVVLDDDGLFISTSPTTNTGIYIYDDSKDVRINADSFIYVISGIDKSATETVSWITDHFKGQVISAGTFSGHSPNNTKKTKHPLNQILYGPPGTGKTFNAINHALAIINNIDVNELINEQKKDPDARKKHKEQFDKFLSSGRIQFVTFHQSYSYEEFVEGIKPIINKHGNIEYKIIDGAFKKICLEASRNVIFDFDDLYDEFTDDLKKSPNIKLQTTKQKKDFTIELNEEENIQVVIASSGKSILIRKEELREYIEKGILPGWWPSYIKAIGEYMKQQYQSKIQLVDNTVNNYVIIIDEINRGNISKIFGELITLIEDSKRIGAVEQLMLLLAYSGTEENPQLFGVPQNVYIIGTMNSTDRSIALIDTALRRRFIFNEYTSEYVLLEKDIEGIDLSNLINTINSRIEYLLDKDHLIGHAYFMGITSKNELCKIFRNKIIPLLQEYFYNDFAKIQLIFGDNKEWKKQEDLKLVIEKTQSQAKIIFGSEIDGYEERTVYAIRPDLMSETYDSINSNVFISIYNNQATKEVEQ